MPESGPGSSHESKTANHTSQSEDDRETCKTEIAKREFYEDLLIELKSHGTRARSDIDQPKLLSRPSWFDESLFENAKTVYARHFMATNFAHLSGLLLLVRVDSIYRTLIATGQSSSVSKLFNRYYQTISHVKKWYEGDIFEENSEAHRSLLIVRGMHNKVCNNLNEATDNADAEPPSDQVHISEYDIMITQFAFVGFIVMRANKVGFIAEFSEHDLRSLLHFWRVIGFYLGASERFNLCSRDLVDIRGLSEAITNLEFKQSIESNPLASPPGLMSVNIVRSLKFIPMLTIYGMLKYLYELFDIDTKGFEARATRYSRLSHYLIGLVMQRLLGYKPLRYFNNGLTRLSLHLVGRMRERFSSRLQEKYGQELNPM